MADALLRWLEHLAVAQGSRPPVLRAKTRRYTHRPLSGGHRCGPWAGRETRLARGEWALLVAAVRLSQAGRPRFAPGRTCRVAPDTATASSVEARLLHKFDALAFTAAEGFEALDLTPVVSLGRERCSPARSRIQPWPWQSPLRTADPVARRHSVMRLERAGAGQRSSPCPSCHTRHR